jgi:hypothetical protein
VIGVDFVRDISADRKHRSCTHQGAGDHGWIWGDSMMVNPSRYSDLAVKLVLGASTCHAGHSALDEGASSCKVRLRVLRRVYRKIAVRRQAWLGMPCLGMPRRAHSKLPLPSVLF